MRTLVISDLHLGQGGGVSVLTRPRPLRALVSVLERYDRLVLLGDTLELQESAPRYSVTVAEPVLRTLARALGPHKQLVLVVGNHDHNLIREWALAQGEQLQLANRVPPDASTALARVVSWLDATRVEVHYPGVWLADGVLAIHGHYLANYLRPMTSWGVHLHGHVWAATPAQLEYPSPAPRPHLRDGLPPERWLDRHIPARLAPVNSHLLGHQMLHHALPAFAASLTALGVQAEWVIFGHVHRRGPRAGEDLRRWRVAASGPRLVNTGSWRYEPVVVRGLDARAEYWPGGGVEIGEDGAPRSVGLLDTLNEADLLAP